MNPSLSAMLVAVGAAGCLVGVDDYSARTLPQLRSLPRVGGLYNPSLEAVAGLRPDLVVLVPSREQRGFRARLVDLGVPVLTLDPFGFDEVLGALRELGARVGRAREAEQRIAAIRATRSRVEALTRGSRRPRAVLVLQRQPLFVVGAGSFLDEMLSAAGGENVGARLGRGYPRASLEWLIAQAPEVILDAAPQPQGALRFWSRWPSLPAVRRRRVVALSDPDVTLPGPYLDRALLTLARALHPDRIPYPASRAESSVR